MAGDFPDDLKDGDALEPWMLNRVFAELRRWRRMTGTGGATVGGADGPTPPVLYAPACPPTFIQLTGAYAAGYPWAEVCFKAGRVVEATGVTGTAALDPAFELQTGDTTLTAGATVYEARRSPASGQLLFDGKN